MKGSTLIKRIQKAIDRYGDLPVRIDHDNLIYLRVKKSKSEDLDETHGKYYIDIRVF